MYKPPSKSRRLSQKIERRCIDMGRRSNNEGSIYKDEK